MQSQESAEIVSSSRRRYVQFVIVAVGVLGIVIVGLLVPIPFRGRTVEAIGDMVHTPLFAAITLASLIGLQWLRPLPFRSRRMVLRSVLILIGLSAFGALAELLQHRFGRSATRHDLISNILGIVAALLWYWSRLLQHDESQNRWLPRLFQLGTGFLFAIAWWSPIGMIRDVRQVHTGFPVLADFEQSAQLRRFWFRRCDCSLSRRYVTDGRYSLALACHPQDYSSASLNEMHSDWNEMESLEFDVTVDAEYQSPDLLMEVYISDDRKRFRSNDLFRKQYRLIPGRTEHIVISRQELIDGHREKALDLGQVAFVEFKFWQPSDPVMVFLDDIRLTLR